MRKVYEFFYMHLVECDFKSSFLAIACPSQKDLRMQHKQHKASQKVERSIKSRAPLTNGSFYLAFHNWRLNFRRIGVNWAILRCIEALYSPMKCHSQYNHPTETKQYDHFVLILCKNIVHNIPAYTTHISENSKSNCMFLLCHVHVLE